MCQTKVVDKIKTYIYAEYFFFSKIVPFMRESGKIFYSRAGHRRKYDTCVLNAG